MEVVNILAELYIHKKNVETVFDLLGELENDITKSIAWAFVKCPALLSLVLKNLLGIDTDTQKVNIQYQVYEKDKGITDLEITDNESFYIVIEAKRGWILPEKEQLNKYAEKEEFNNDSIKHKAIVSMSECSEEYAATHLPQIDVPLKHLSWKKICELSEMAMRYSNNSQKIILKELERYIKRIMSTQNKDTNWVYVVSLGKGNVELSDATGEHRRFELTWIDVVKKYNMYFCPIGGTRGSWPREPLNYIAFRYDGKLQSIHHIEGYKIVDELHSYIPEIPYTKMDVKHYLYELGPEIKPIKEVKTGDRIRMNNRVWAQIDTLLTSDTISEAYEISKNRKE